VKESERWWATLGMCLAGFFFLPLDCMLVSGIRVVFFFLLNSLTLGCTQSIMYVAIFRTRLWYLKWISGLLVLAVFVMPTVLCNWCFLLGHVLLFKCWYLNLALLISVCREKQKLLVVFVCCLEVSETLLLQQEVGYLQDGYTLLQCCSTSLVLESTSPILHLKVPETISIISNFYINHD